MSLPDTYGRRAVRRGTSPLTINTLAVDWAKAKEAADDATSTANKFRDQLASHIAASSRTYVDADGNQWFDLDVPIGYKGKDRARLKRERAVSRGFVDDIEDRIKAMGPEVYARVYPPKPTLDQDALWAAYQDGQLSDADMEGLFQETISWRFKAV